MRTGILGYPQSGKTTLFNLLARAHAPTGSFASASGGINVGTVQVPDPRLEALRDLFDPKKYTPARIEYVDLAGPASSGSGGNGALLPPQITVSDLVLLVIRAFDDPAVAHPRSSVDPLRDLSDLTDELVLKDMAVLEGRLGRVRKNKSVGSKEGVEEIGLLERSLAHLETGAPLRELDLTEEEGKLLRGFGLLSAKPLLVVFNLGDEATPGGLLGSVPAAPGRLVVEINGKAEMEIAELPEDEVREFMELLGIQESGLAQVIRKSYELLDLCSFFTVGKDEVRAWNIDRGTRAPGAAGAIHSDLQRGFIRAEVVTSHDLLDLGGLGEAKAANRLRVEGKDYVVKDGDVLNIRFSV